MRALSAFLALAAMALPATAETMSLRLPVDCEIGRTCFIQHYVDRDSSAGSSDHQCGTMTYDGHSGTDIRVPTTADQRRGVDVLAASGGRVMRVRDGVEDAPVADRGRESVEATECGNGAVIDHGHGWETQYCHMAKGSMSVRPGDQVEAGDPIGRIGLSGLTEFPHLHFTLRKDGAVVDPFAFEGEGRSCGSGRSLWELSAQAALTYRAGAVLNKGFAAAPVTMEAIESGAAERDIPDLRSPALVAFVRAIGLRGGDRQTLTLVDPAGKPLASNEAPPLDRNKAQWMLFSGVKSPPGGFRPGLYRALFSVTRDDKVVIEQAFEIELRN